MIKLSSWILIFSILVSLFAVPVCAANIGNDATIVPNNDIETFAQSLADGLNSGRNLNLTVCEIKELCDFAGNTYYAIEFSPTGYGIVHGETRTIVELGVDSPSPYLGYQKGLFYGGPTYYYFAGIDSLTHTILQETYPEEEIENAVTINTEIHNKLCEVGNKTDTEEIANTSRSIRNYIDGSEIIRNLNTRDELGYFSVGNGACGFIAAGLFLLFWDQTVDNIINDFAFLNSSGTAFDNSNFNEKLLYDYGKGNDASSSASGLGADSSIKEVLESYLSDSFCDIDISLMLNTFSVSQAIDHLETDNSPAICFGVFYSPKYDAGIDNPTTATTQHAVLVYGWTSDDRLIANFGWPTDSEGSYSAVELVPQLAGDGLYGVNGRSLNPVFTDIPSTSWAYDEAVYCARYKILDIQRNNGNTFGYSAPMTRAMFVNGLYHLVGEPQVSDEDKENLINFFDDISESTKYIDAITWAYENECMSGYASSDSAAVRTMRPTTSITREEAAAMLKSFVDEAEEVELIIDPDDTLDYEDFEDSEDISAWAIPYVEWAYQCGLFSGDDEGNFLPKSTITKAQAAVVFHKIPVITIRNGGNQ